MNMAEAKQPLVLHDHFRSSASFRTRIALNLKDIPYERVEISIIAGEQKSDAYLAMNAQGLVPLLQIGDEVIIQSLAIMDWLDRQYPEPRLIPEEPMARAVALAQAQLVIADIHPLQNTRTLKYLSRDLGLNEQVRQRWIAHWMLDGFDALEAMAGDGLYLGGDQPSIADCALVPQMLNARRYEVELHHFPRLLEIEAACMALPAFQKAHPDAVKTL
jgi:maleylacetoacetate isomerase